MNMGQMRAMRGARALVRAVSSTSSDRGGGGGGRSVRLPRFYAEKAAAAGTIEVRGSEARHAAKVLRLKPGDCVEICDGDGVVSEVSLTHCAADRVAGHVMRSSARPWVGVRWRLAVAGTLKGGRGDYLIEKACELGAYSVLPLSTDHARMPIAGERSASRGGSGGGRASRWRRLAVAASKQCLRDHLLQIEDPRSLDDILADGALPPPPAAPLHNFVAVAGATPLLRVCSPPLQPTPAQDAEVRPYALQIDRAIAPPAPTPTPAPAPPADANRDRTDS